MIAQVLEGQSEEEVSPATNKPLKKHEKWGLKGLTGEQQVNFWEDVIYWSKERFSEAKWREVVRRIERAKAEDNVIVFGWHPSPQPIHSITTTGGRHLLLYSSSSLTSPTGAHPLRPTHLPRIATSSSTTPRPRWDVVPSGPITPLSATSGSVKNAFAEGGFWASLTPKTSFTAIPVSTPTTVVPVEPWAPETPKAPEAKVAYGEVKKDVNKMALQLCASRLALQRSSNGEGDVIHPSMVKPKDELQAAELILESRQLDLSKLLDTSVSEKIEHAADEEAACLRQYSISTAYKLQNIDSWLQFDERTGDLTNVLEAQRELFRMNRDRRNHKDNPFSSQALQLAWAVKIVDDAAYLVEIRADAESADSDEDQGYDYGNFVRSLRSQTISDLRESVEERVHDAFGSVQASSATNYLHTTTANHSGQTTTPKRSSSSPVKPAISSYAASVPLRARDATLSSTQQHLSTTPLRPRNATAHRKNLSIITGVPVPNLPSLATPEMSPEERGSRHQGPSIEDLSSWADELKAMERKRAEMKLSGRMNGLGHGRGVGSATTVRSRKAGRSEKSARTEAVTRVNRCIHPAFRTALPSCTESGVSLALSTRNETPSSERGEGLQSARSSISSGSSWLCETAAEVEKCASTLSSHATMRHDDSHAEDRDSSTPPHHPGNLRNLDSRFEARLSPPRRPSLLPSTLPSALTVPISTPAPAPYNRLAPTSLERRAANEAYAPSKRQEEEEEEWERELVRMEERERVRQREVCEREREREKEREKERESERRCW